MSVWNRWFAPPPAPTWPPADETPEQKAARQLRVLRLVYRAYDIDYAHGVWTAALRYMDTPRMRAAGVIPYLKSEDEQAFNALLADQFYRVIIGSRVPEEERP